MLVVIGVLILAALGLIYWAIRERGRIELLNGTDGPEAGHAEEDAKEEQGQPDVPGENEQEGPREQANLAQVHAAESERGNVEDEEEIGEDPSPPAEATEEDVSNAFRKVTE